MAMKKLRSLMPYFLSALCIIGYAFYMYTEFNSFNSSHVSEWEERMEPIRDALPLGIFEAGYLAESDIPNNSVAFDEAEFFMSQYALAPVALIRGFQSSWIVGNFGSDASIKDIGPWLENNLREYKIQNFGFGIYLIQDIPE